MSAAKPELRNPPGFAHVGVTVPDLDGAVSWYRDAVGLDLIAGPTEVVAGRGHAGRMAADVLGAGFRSFRQAHLATSDGSAIELFEFQLDPNQPGFPYARAGCSHFCLVQRDIEGAVDRVVRAGGRRLSRTWRLAPDSEYRMCYCQDPFGLVIELYSHPQERATLQSQSSSD